MLSEKKIVEFYKEFVALNSAYKGKFYVGIKTTGVFCRPICAEEKPKLVNCEFFTSAKEALYASYRCCKRCNPLSPPGLIPASIAPLIDAVEEKPEVHWTVNDFKTTYPNAVQHESQFKHYFNMTFVDYACARRMGLAMSYIRFGSSTSGDAFSKFMEPVTPGSTHILQASWLETVLGPMIAIADKQKLYLLEFIDRKALETEIKNLRKKLKASVVPGTNALIKQTNIELSEYFDKKRTTFNVPLSWAGSHFQKVVWEALVKIPIGKTITYAELAKVVGHPGACRAVGTANGANKLSILIPCHRVINADGNLGGYGGGIYRKLWLLRHEQDLLV